MKILAIEGSTRTPSSTLDHLETLLKAQKGINPPGAFVSQSWISPSFNERDKTSTVNQV